MSSDKKLQGPSFEEILALRTCFGEDRPIALLPLGINNKVPLVPWKSITERGYGWSPEELEERWRGRENIGMICGEPSNNTWVADCDGKHSARWALKHFPPTLIKTITGSEEGLHLHYPAPAGEMCGNRADILNSKAKWEYEARKAGFDIRMRVTPDMTEEQIETERERARQARADAEREIELGPVIDIRGKGGQVVLPGSVHKSGNRYRAHRPWTPELFDAQDKISPSVIDELVERYRWENPERKKHGTIDPLDDLHFHSEDEKYRRAQKWLNYVDGAISGDQGHNKTFSPANKLVRGFDLGVEAAVHLMLTEWNIKCDPPWDEKDIRHKCEDAERAVDGRPRGWMLTNRDSRAIERAIERKKSDKTAVEYMSPEKMIRSKYEEVDPDIELAEEEEKVLEGEIFADDVDAQISAAMDLAAAFSGEKSVDFKISDDLSDQEREKAKTLAKAGINYEEIKQDGWLWKELTWKQRGESGEWVMRPTVGNMAMVLAYSKIFKGKLQYDKLKDKFIYNGEYYEDNHYPGVIMDMERVFKGHPIADTKLREAIKAAGLARTIDPVKDFVDSIQEWNGEDTCRKIVVENFGIDEKDENVELYARMLQNTFVGLVARMIRPGSKMDTVLILQGNQGYRKSTFFADLFPEGLSTGAESFDFRNKDGLSMVAQYVAIEMGECVHIRSEKDYESLKQFLSQTEDTFRKPYGRELKTHKRHCVFFASANDEQLFFDPTGTRRFYVIPVKRKMEYGEAIAVRDQLFAQAKHAYLENIRARAANDTEAFERTRWWFETDDHWEEKRHQANRAYEDHHPWEAPIEEYCAEHAGKEVTSILILTKVLDKPMGQITSGDQRVVGRIMKRLGCANVTKRVDGVRKRIWTIPKSLAPTKYEPDRDGFGWSSEDS